MKLLGNDLLFAFIKCSCWVTLSVYHPTSTTPRLEKRSMIHIKGEDITGEILGEFKGIYILMPLSLAFLFWILFLTFGILLPRRLEGYKGLGAALHVGASCSGKTKQKQGRAQGRMTQASCSQPQGGELLFLLFFGFILPNSFKLLDHGPPGESVSLREGAKLATVLLLVWVAQGFWATEVLFVSCPAQISRSAKIS